MLKEVTVTADTVEKALMNALAELGAEQDDVEYEVLQKPKKKKFGLFGGSPAMLRVFIPEKSPAEKAAEYIRDVAEKMGVTNPVAEITADEPDHIDITVNGGNIKYIIGYRGDVLDSLEYLTCLVSNSSKEGYKRISLNVGDFREKREETLKRLAGKMAFKCRKTGKSIKLEPMNSFERKVIHNTIEEIDGVISWGEGKGVKRHVVVAPEDSDRARNYLKQQEKLQRQQQQL